MRINYYLMSKIFLINYYFKDLIKTKMASETNNLSISVKDNNCNDKSILSPDHDVNLNEITNHKQVGS